MRRKLSSKLSFSPFGKCCRFCRDERGTRDHIASMEHCRTFAECVELMEHYRTFAECFESMEHYRTFAECVEYFEPGTRAHIAWMEHHLALAECLGFINPLLRVWLSDPSLKIVVCGRDGNRIFSSDVRDALMESQEKFSSSELSFYFISESQEVELINCLENYKNGFGVQFRPSMESEPPKEHKLIIDKSLEDGPMEFLARGMNGRVIASSSFMYDKLFKEHKLTIDKSSGDGPMEFLARGMNGRVIASSSFMCDELYKEHKLTIDKSSGDAPTEFVTMTMDGRAKEYRSWIGESPPVGHGCHPDGRRTGDYPTEDVAVRIDGLDEKLDSIWARVEQLFPRIRARYFDWVALLTLVVGFLECLAVLVDFFSSA